MTDREPLDLDAIETKWLQTCPSCDAGLPMACMHPIEDYRAPMSDLVDEVRRLREELAQAELRLDLADDDMREADER